MNSGSPVGSGIRALVAYNGSLYVGDYTSGKVYQVTPVTATPWLVCAQFAISPSKGSIYIDWRPLASLKTTLRADYC